MTIDNRFEKVVSLISDVETRLEDIVTEADARLQLIDRFLTEILGWDLADMSTEPHSENGYTDYLLKLSNKPALVLEAKRIGHLLVNTANPAVCHYKVGGPALRAAKGGIDQAAKYSLDHGADLAVVTTGIAWIAFQPFVGGGISFSSRKAIVFPNLQSIKDNFALFHDLFSKEGVAKHFFKVQLAKVGGLDMAQFEPLEAVCRPGNAKMIQRTKLATDLDPVFREFFGAISGDDDHEMLLECFVETRESRQADAALEKIVHGISSSVSQLETGSGDRLVREIETIVESGRGETVVIVGNKGAGKSTFIKRFFKLVLNRVTRKKCLLVHIDLLEATGTVDTITDWLTRKSTKSIEDALFENGIASYDELQGMYWTEYQKWRSGIHAYLYQTDKNAFKIKFGEYLGGQINVDPHGYLLRLIEHAVKARKLLPCLVFDNADHYEELFQEVVFQWSQAIRKEVAFSLVLMPITDRTIWRLSKAGPFQTYGSKLFYLPVPSAKAVLQKRVTFLAAKAGQSIGGRDYFLQRGIRLSVENLVAFAACLEEIFINEDFVSRRVSWLSNHDIRRSLVLSQDIICSPFMSIEDLVTAFLKRSSGGAVKIGYRSFMEALLLKNYDQFQQDDHSFLLNVFSISPRYPTTPLLKLRVLKLLIDQAGDESGSSSYFPIDKIRVYFELMGIEIEELDDALEGLLARRLVEPFDASEERVTNTQRLAVTHSGRMHYEMSTTDPIYLRHMALTTPIRTTSVVDRLKAVRGDGAEITGSDWNNIRRVFVLYCMGQDRLYVKVPIDPIYNGQRQLVRDLNGKWVGNKLEPKSEKDEIPEIADPVLTGRNGVSAEVIWFDADKGYGFLKSDEGEEIFLHQTLLNTFGIQIVTVGDLLVCDIGPGKKGRFQAIAIYSIEAAPPLETKSADATKEYRGSIKFYDPTKGFGFIELDELEEDIYLSKYVLEKGAVENLEGGAKVVVNLAPPGRGKSRSASFIRQAPTTT